MLSIIVNKTEDICAFRKNLNVERCMECAREMCKKARNI